MSEPMPGVRALVFGTVVDWRSGVAREAAPFLARHGAAGADRNTFAAILPDFVPRPSEHGPGQTRDLGPAQDGDAVADSFEPRADALGL